MRKTQKLKYIPELGRHRFYDYCKQGIKRHSPQWFRKLVQTATMPLGVLNLRREMDLEICRTLPHQRQGEFIEMYKEARLRWDNGLVEATGEPIEFPIKETGFSAWLRPGTCDVITYYDVIVHELYGKAAPDNASTIIDCGANIGLSSAYFLARYPLSIVIALEPDPINFVLCQKNLEQFGNRVRLFPKALWSRSCRMQLGGTQVGTWGSYVEPDCGGGRGGLDAIDMASLISENCLKNIDILKMDIEGAEVEVLSSEDLSWLEIVKSFQIETKVERGRDLFISRLEVYGFSFAKYGEIMIAYRKNSDDSSTH